MESVFPTRSGFGFGFFFSFWTFPTLRQTMFSFLLTSFYQWPQYDHCLNATYLPIAFSSSNASAKDKAVLKTYIVASFLVFFLSSFLYLAPVPFICLLIPFYKSVSLSQFGQEVLTCHESCLVLSIRPPSGSSFHQGLSGEEETTSSSRLKTEALP